MTTTPIDSDSQGTSTRPYLIRALHDWCTDNGFTPYLAVYVDRSVQVPQEYVKNNEIVLNVSFEATTQLQLGNEFVEFKARFGGIAREISVPVDHVIAIYARENGQGMAFPVPTASGWADDEQSIDDSAGVDSPVDGTDRSASPLRLARTPRAAPVKEKERANSKASAKEEDKSPTKALSSVSIVSSEGDEPPPDSPPPSGAGRPALRRVK
ncbi:ClpXP protease specificity-enhancing factor [Aquabacterium sp.]|uniref:ClpXP protease specificity-enhancing factor n=1 Tax=Aquabacterium sp. TaxID=1872578 RepID=UPI0019C3620C|nr:ClpXP protease specificity-enhancing factor [Aquabacterium sp.]MBC7701353.1 ClpXP protease specificity-enhancing factor [Aquabacterium sp.]